MKNTMQILATAMFAAISLLPAGYAQAEAIQGEVRKIDEAAGKITLKHGPIKSLGMDMGMTWLSASRTPRC